MLRCAAACSLCAAGRYVFEHTLVLPEYLVEYEYEATATCALARGAVMESLDSQGQAALDGLDYDIRLIARPLVPLLLEASAAELDEHGNPLVQLSGKERGMEVVNSGPQLEARSKVAPGPLPPAGPGRATDWVDPAPFGLFYSPYAHIQIYVDTYTYIHIVFAIDFQQNAGWLHPLRFIGFVSRLGNNVFVLLHHWV